LAEGVGFEPTVSFPTSVFKTEDHIDKLGKISTWGRFGDGFHFHKLHLGARSCDMAAHKKTSIEPTENGFLACVGRSKKKLPSMVQAEAWVKIMTASKLMHCRYQFNAEDRRPFIVAYPEIDNDGRPVTKRKKFATFPEARRFAEERDIATENHGRSFSSILSNDEIAAVTAWRSEAARLRDKGVDVPSLADTLRLSLNQLTTCPDGRKLNADLIEAFITHKIDQGIGKRQEIDYQCRLARFLESFHDRLAASISSQEIEAWLSGLMTRRNADVTRVSAQTRKHYRAALHAFFEWLLPEKNPVTRVTAPRVREPERDHYNSNEAAILLNWLKQHHAELLPATVLGLFCGLRTAEIMRLDLSVIDLSKPDEEGEFILRATQTKTGKARAVPLPPAAKAWLLAQSLRSGPAMRTEMRQYHKRLADAMKSAGVRPVKNGFRHSFASYRGAILRDSARLSDELGNSAAVVARHYRDAKLEAEAKAYFAIRPDETSTPIVHLNQVGTA
jgi:integrase